MLRTAFTWLSIAVAVLILPCHTEAANAGRTDTASLDAYFREHFPPNEPGGAVLIMKGESVVFSKGYGLADLRSKEPISPDTLFNIGSISKTFVANAILLLQEQGRLSVEDSLAQYFPDFKHQTIARAVRIKHLLTHSSGLPDNRQVESNREFYLTAKDQENWYPTTQADALVFEPGAKFEYSNPAFCGLALIVEKVSGMKWQRFIADTIFAPAGMIRSTITDGPHPERGVSHGYVKVEEQWKEADYGEEPTFAAAGNSGVWSSVAELAKYELALSSAVFLKRETIQESRETKRFSNWREEDPPLIGWAWFIGQTPDGLRSIGHAGSQGGFLSNYVTIPEKGIFFVILCNTPRDIEGFTERIMDWLKTNNWGD